MAEIVNQRRNRQNILDLANHMGCKKKGAKDEYDFLAPEYLLLEVECVTDEMAEVIMHFQRREKVNASIVSKRSGKSRDEVLRILTEAADVGLLIMNEVENQIDSEACFWFEPWVPGVMEMMANHKENVRKYPQIAEAFEAYGRIRGGMSTGLFPVGIGLMRVIPIESAIDGNSKSASYEEISKYLNENHLFSVSDCSCRTSREVMNEGCGHLKEDMCIQMGHAAEYYIKTGRGREITREEAFDIIKRAEENGLMHQIPNIDGSGHTHAICNCCGCGCLALRSAEMFYNVDMVRSNYVAKVNKENCVACGECVKNCPVNALKLGQKICSSEKIVDSLERKETPRNTVWDASRYNEDYRINRENVVESGTAPCKTTCPAHISVQGYIKLASQKRYKEALELIKKDNPFPAICGRICPHECESECTRSKRDEAIAIDDIKKFIADKELFAEYRFTPRIKHNYLDKKIAVIGSGPAGLSAAYYLAEYGYSVTVFEKERVLGGMLSLGIPNFRLEKEVIQSEIEVLKEMGVNFILGKEIGKDITINELRKDGYKGFFIGVGAGSGKLLELSGSDSLNVFSGIDFLRRVNLKEEIELKDDVLVIGGGNVAIDVARTAKRLGGKNTKIICLESREEMPALKEEILETLEEEIEIINSYAIKELIVENKIVKKVIIKKVKRVFDELGNFDPKYDLEDIIELKCTNLIMSVGQTVDFKGLFKDENVELNPNGTIKCDKQTLQSSVLDIFAGGDCLTGPKYAIHAIAAGKEGAISLHRFVNKGQSLVYGRDNLKYSSLNVEAALVDSFDYAKRQITKNNTAEHFTFKDKRLNFTEEQMIEETMRCLGCGATIVDEFLCVGCGQCTMNCKFDAISLERVYDKEGKIFEKMKKEVVKNVIKRKFIITTKKIKEGFKKHA